MFYIIDNIKQYDLLLFSLFMPNNIFKSYFDDIDRIMAAGYVPNDEDILKSRATTNGIYETEFDIAHAHFRYVYQTSTVWGVEEGSVAIASRCS